MQLLSITFHKKLQTENQMQILKYQIYLEFVDWFVLHLYENLSQHFLKLYHSFCFLLQKRWEQVEVNINWSIYDVQSININL